MATNLSNDEAQVIGAARQLPSVSIIMPFKTNISLQNEMDYKLKVAIDKLKKDLLLNYPENEAALVVGKIQHIVDQLTYPADKKAVAIFISPVTEKVLFLDFEVDEKIVIDQTFEVRDLLYNKQQKVKCLVLLLSGKQSKLCQVDGHEVTWIDLPVPADAEAYKNDLPERVTNFTDPGDEKQILLDRYLHHIDEGLTSVLKSNSYPLFIMGPEKVLGYFNKISKNGKSIAGTIQGNYLEATTAELTSALKPQITNWQKVKEQNILQQLDVAMNEKRVAAGMHEVWKAVNHNNGRLLVVEKDFRYPAHEGPLGENVYKEDLGLNRSVYIKDAADDVMEKVLSCGGEVAFVDNGKLDEYEHIALIQYYNA